jgi:hypothetical protein
MKRAFVVAVVVGLACSSVSKANITNVWYRDDGDGAFVCGNPGTWTGSTNALSLGVNGKECGTPGHLLLNVYTDSPDDPTLKIDNSIDNDTSFAWTQFTVNLTMNVSFTLTNVFVSTPGDWQVVSGDNQTATYTGSNYLATVVYDTGAAIATNDTIEFGYWVKFSGSPAYTITQEMVPVPEPSSWAMVAFGAIALLGSRRLRRRSS